MTWIEDFLKNLDASNGDVFQQIESLITTLERYKGQQKGQGKGSSKADSEIAPLENREVLGQDSGDESDMDNLDEVIFFKDKDTADAAAQEKGQVQNGDQDLQDAVMKRYDDIFRRLDLLVGEVLPKSKLTPTHNITTPPPLSSSSSLFSPPPLSSSSIVSSSLLSSASSFSFSSSSFCSSVSFFSSSSSSFSSSFSSSSSSSSRSLKLL